MNAPNAPLGNSPEILQTEFAVLGSGPGGSITACLLAEAGKNVLLVEEGAWLPLDPSIAFTQTEMIQKYRNGGITVATGPTKVAYVEGRCVGGGSEINSGLYHRTPPEVLEAWRLAFKLEGLQDLDAHFQACERDLSVSYLPGRATPAALKLHEGATGLGWKSLEVPRWHKYPAQDAASSNSRGVRQTMTETFVPRFLRAGGRLLPNTKARRLRRTGARWQITALEQPIGSSTRRIEIKAQNVFVACGAIQTPLLLRRSRITRNVGNHLQMHPTVKVVARFPEEVNALDSGVPSHQVKEFAPRISFGCSISAPPYLALAMLDHPEHLHEVQSSWKKMAIYYAMITGKGSGSVRPVPGFNDPLVRYRLADEDYRDLAEGLQQLCRALLAAGAEALYPGCTGFKVIRSESDLQTIPLALPKARTNLMTIHLFSTCPMGEDLRTCATDSFGRVHGAEGLYVADASLLCGAPSVNPQGSVMAFARRNALHFLGEA